MLASGRITGDNAIAASTPPRSSLSLSLHRRQSAWDHSNAWCGAWVYAPLRKTLSNTIPQRVEPEIRRLAELVVFGGGILCGEVLG